MKNRSIISQCRVDPNIFFYYSVSPSKNMGIYYFDDFVNLIDSSQSEGNSKYRLLFSACSEEIHKSILLDEKVSQKIINEYSPTFSWCNSDLIGAFTTGISKNINILQIHEKNCHIKGRIGSSDCFSLNLDWNNKIDNSNLLLSCEIFNENGSLDFGGIISIYDVNYNRKITEVQNLLNSEPDKSYFVYPKSGKWINSHCLISGWTFNNLDRICLHDIRVRNSPTNPFIQTNCGDFLSINSFENHYLLSSNLRNFIRIYDLRFLKAGLNIKNAEFQALNEIKFIKNEIGYLDWFPYKRDVISISTNSDIFVIEMNKDNEKHNDKNRAVLKENNIIQWNENLISHFESLEIEDSVNGAYCWYNNSLNKNKNEYSLVYLSGNSAYYKYNLSIKINLLNSFQQFPFFTYFPTKEQILDKNIYNHLVNPSLTLGYSWISHRLIKYFEEKSVKNLNIELLLMKWCKINSLEAQYLVEKYKTNPNVFRQIGIFTELVSNRNEIIRMIKSTSHMFNCLLHLPEKFIYWQELFKNLNFFLKNGLIKDGILNFSKENFFFPSIREIVNILRMQVGYEDTSHRIEFINLNFENNKKSAYNEVEKQVDQFYYLEVFSSPIREKLISICGISSVTGNTPKYKEKNDSSMIETYLFIFLWNCVTLQYQNFLLQCDFISNLLDFHLEDEFKSLKTSFMNNLILFLNSAGIILSGTYRNYEEFNKNLNNKDIYFYYMSVISTSELLLDCDHYLSIWNCNIFLESVLQLSIRFILTVIRYINRSSDETLPFSLFLLEHLFNPCININSYIYIPFHLLLIIGLYYLPISEVFILIEKMVEKMIQNGLLDGIFILGLQDVEKNRIYQKQFERYEKVLQKRNVLFQTNNTNDNISQRNDKITMSELNFYDNQLFKISETREKFNIENLNQIISSEKILKSVIQSYLSLSFGDIQTIALIGSCFLPYFGRDNLLDIGLVDIFDKCINLYRKFLNNNSATINSLNKFKPINIISNGYRTTKVQYNTTLRALYELNLIASCYLTLFENFESEILVSSLPSGNILYCYYCEQPLFQTSFEINNSFSSNTSKTEPTVNSYISVPKDISEIHLEDNIQKYLSSTQESEKTSSHVTSNKIVSNATSSYYPDNTSNIETQSGSIILNCPNKSCNKPLPRCVICLTEVSLNKLNRQKICSEENEFPGNSREIEKWYSWCLHCHHGGCFKHINEWFECFDECPVPECNCWCNAIDPWSCM